MLGPPISQAADFWGRPWFTVDLTLLGVIGSVIMARATSMNMAIAGEVISGLAFGVQAVLHAVIAEVLPRQCRPYAQACSTVSAGLGGVVGLLVGEAMTLNGNNNGFRNFWYMTTALYAVSTVSASSYMTPLFENLKLGAQMQRRYGNWIGFAIYSSLRDSSSCV